MSFYGFLRLYFLCVFYCEFQVFLLRIFPLLQHQRRFDLEEYLRVYVTPQKKKNKISIINRIIIHNSHFKFLYFSTHNCHVHTRHSIFSSMIILLILSQKKNTTTIKWHENSLLIYPLILQHQKQHKAKRERKTTKKYSENSKIPHSWDFWVIKKLLSTRFKPISFIVLSFFSSSTASFLLYSSLLHLLFFQTTSKAYFQRVISVG